MTRRDTRSASYDNQSGTVTLNFGFYDPGTWGAAFSTGDGGAAASSGALLTLDPSDSRQGGIDVELGNQNQSACEQQDPFPAGPLTAVLMSEYDEFGNFTYDDVYAQLEGFNGNVYEPVSFNGTTFTTTLQNGAFTGHAWNCLVFDGYGLTLNSPPGPPRFEGAVNQGHPVSALYALAERGRDVGRLPRSLVSVGRPGRRRQRQRRVPRLHSILRRVADPSRRRDGPPMGHTQLQRAELLQQGHAV